MLPRMYQAVLSGQKTPKQALEDVKKDADKAIKTAMEDEKKLQK